MKHQEFIHEVAARTLYTPKEIRKIIATFSDVLEEHMARGEDVRLWRVGVFENLPVPQKKGRHPITGQPLIIPPTRRVRFSPGQGLKRVVRESYKLFKEDNTQEKYNGKIRSGD